MAIKAYLEFLFHFTCGKCGKWFSIGDWNVSGRLTCPHCGCTQRVLLGNNVTMKFIESVDKED